MSQHKTEFAIEKDASRKREILKRLSLYLSKYSFRLSIGIFLSLVVSFTNLFSLTAFVPIFNVMGETGSITLFSVGNQERKNRDMMLRGEDGLTTYEELLAHVTDLKIRLNEYAADKTPREVIFLICAFIFPVYVVKLLSITGASWAVGTSGLMAVRNIRNDLYKKLNRLGISFFQQERTGFLMSRVINDVELVGRSMSADLTETIINIFYIVTHIALLALISWKMLLVTVVLIPLLIAPVSKFAMTIRKAAMGQQERLAEMGAHVQEILAGIRVIRAFAMEKFEAERFGTINEKLYKNTFKGHYYHQVGPALTEFVASAVVLGFLVWGAMMITDSQLKRGDFFVFFFTLIFIMRPLKQIGVTLNLMSSSLAAAVRIFALLDEPIQQVTLTNDKSVPFAFTKQIEFKNVSFSYHKNSNERKTLQNINFNAAIGTTTSVVGASGAGKSTLMDLLPRFLDPDEGSIRIDGVDIDKFYLQKLRRSIGVVNQNIFLFNATVKENIAYGREDISIERVKEAARMAGAHDFITGFPDGYDAMIGERGIMLSGGQRQRIAIARAILLDPPILIFDEATSALDSESEMLVQQAMEHLLKNRTVFIIAHRLSTVYRSDQILVMDQGQIAEQGKHQELLDQGAIYKKLYEMQFSDEALT